MKKILLTVVLAITALMVGRLSVAMDQHVSVPQITNFKQLGDEAKEKNLPILMMFSSDHCPWCEQVEEDFLIPMKKSGEYIDRAIITKFKVDGYETIIDFDGKVTDVDTIQRRYKAYMTPTIFYLNADGKQLTKPQIGMTTPDYFGFYIDQAIEQSLAKIRKNLPLTMKTQ